MAAYEEFLEGPDDYYRELLRDAATRDREAELWVAVDDDGTLLGSVTSCPPGSPWRELSVDDEGEFRMLAVAPAARGRGVGEALVRQCEERAARDRRDPDVALDAGRDGPRAPDLRRGSATAPSRRATGTRSPSCSRRPPPGLDQGALSGGDR